MLSRRTGYSRLGTEGGGDVEGGGGADGEEDGEDSTREGDEDGDTEEEEDGALDVVVWEISSMANAGGRSKVQGVEKRTRVGWGS